MDDFEQFSAFAESQKPKEEEKYTDIRETLPNNEGYDDFFNYADKNADGQLNPEEAKALPQVDTKEEFKLADENKDGLVSFDEYVNSLPEEQWNAIDKAPDEKSKYNAFSKTLNDYYNEYINTLDPNDPDYEGKVGAAQDDAEEQIRKAGYWNYNPATGKDNIVDKDFDPKQGSIAKDTKVKEGVQSVINRAINEHNVDEMAEVLRDVIPNLPLYTDTEKAEEGRQMQEKFEGEMSAIRNLGYNEAMENDVFSGIHKVEDTGEIWQELVSDDVYKRLADWSFEELEELSQKVPNIRWKKLANAVARSETSDKEKQKKVSKEWLQDWKDYVKKVDKSSEYLNELSKKHIEKEEVEQVLYRDYVQEEKSRRSQNKSKTIQKKKEEKPLQPTSATSATSATPTPTYPIQLTEKTNVREKIIEEAARHIMKHGRTLPKELKKSIEELPAKFEPFKFEHNKGKEESISEGKPLTFERGDDSSLGIEFGTASEGNVPNGSVMQSGYGSDGGSVSGGISKSRSVNVSSVASPGGMSLPDLPEPKMSMGGMGTFFDGIGSFDTSKKRPIKISMPKESKGKKVEFPDLSPDVEQHNEMERVPQRVKTSRPIIKNGLYQDKDDKVDNYIYSKVISDIIDEYKKWKKVDDVYIYDIPQLNITLYYDGVSQPKIKAKDTGVSGLGGKQNISTLLRKDGGREILENLYNYLEGEE